MSSQASAIVSAVRISSVWRGLGGGELLRGRGRAFWRKGDGLNVSVRDHKGVWFDHVENIGGGILDLIAHVKGGSKKDALYWLSDYIGVPINDEPVTPEELARIAARERELVRELPAALLWRRTALVLADELLDQLKSALFAPDMPAIEVDQIAFWTNAITRWKRLDEESLVAEFLRWKEKDHAFTGAMVQAAALHQTADRRAIERLVAHNGLALVRQGATS